MTKTAKVIGTAFAVAVVNVVVNGISGLLGKIDWADLAIVFSNAHINLIPLIILNAVMIVVIVIFRMFSKMGMIELQQKTIEALLAQQEATQRQVQKLQAGKQEL